MKSKHIGKYSMGFFSLFSHLSPAHIHMVTLFSRATFMGKDQLGNKYFQAKPRKGYHLPRRWVMYKGQPEASTIPPEWHGWLHHQTNAIPEEGTQSFRRKWQKQHQPNMTGTNRAYYPKGHTLSGGKRNKATGDYEAWIPPQ